MKNPPMNSSLSSRRDPVASTARLWRPVFRAAALCCLGAAATNGDPLGNDCATAPSLGVGTHTFDLSSTVQSEDFFSACGGFLFFSQYLQFNPPGPGTYLVRFTTFTGGEGRLSASAACPTFGGQANDCVSTADCGPNATLRLTGPALLIVSQAEFANTLAGTISITAAPAPTSTDGDICARATPASLGSNAFDTSTSADNDFPGTLFLDSQDKWFTYTPSQSGNFTASVCTTTNAGVSLYSGCNEVDLLDAKGCEAASYVVAGQPVLVRVTARCGGAGTVNLSLTPAARPANDTCAGAVSVALGTTEYDNTFASTDGQDPCPSGFGSGGKDLFFSFTAPATAQYIITSLGGVTSSPNGLMEYPTFVVLNGCTGFPLACVNTGFGTVGFRVSLSAGQTYFLQVNGLGNFNISPYTPFSRGAGAFTITQVVTPSNDLCANAQNVGEGQFAFNLVGANGEATSCIDNTFTEEPTRDIFYFYTPTFSGPVEIGTVPTNAPGLSAQGAAVSIFSACGGTELATAVYNTYDDFGAAYARLRTNVMAGVPVLIRVALAFPDTVNQQGTLYVGSPRLPALAPNDECADAATISSGLTTFSFAGATFPNCTPFNFDCSASTCDLTYGEDLWYKFTPTSAGTVTVNPLSIGGPDNGLGLIAKAYSTCGGTPIACNVQDCGGVFNPSFTFNATANQTYYLRVMAYSASGGTINLTLPGCRADFNSSGSVTVQDIFDFLNAYFTNLPAADFNASGSVTVQDIFDFLGAYFAGC